MTGPTHADRQMLDRSDRRDDPTCWVATSDGAMVVAPHYRATAIGREILAAGGNAIDAAVATSVALTMADPASSGLGGMAMMLVHHAATGRAVTIEGPCRAPSAASVAALASQRSRYAGYSAVAIPTQPSVVAHALREFGTMTAERVLAPSIELAERGMPWTPFQCGVIERYAGKIRKHGGAALILEDGEVPAPGSWRRNAALAATLRKLARDGIESFYHGEVGAAILDDSQRHGGLLRADDFDPLPSPIVGEPVEGRFGDLVVRSLAPPGEGTALVQLLKIHDALAPDLDPDAPGGPVAFADVIRRVRLDRRSRLRATREQMARAADYQRTDDYANEAANRIRRGSGGETAHVCVFDRAGNAVSMTQSIERSFGARVATPELGFLYNGYMKTFNLKDPAHPQYLRPGNTARSNAAPALLVDRTGRPRIAIGSTGSERLTSGMYQVLVRLRSQSPFDAVRAPRIHASPEGVVTLEADRFSEPAKQALVDAGYELKPTDPWSFQMGGLQLAVVDGSTVTGVGDPRRDSAAAGVDR